MRFSICLIALALLPMMIIAHGWFYAEKQQPGLQAAALEVLQTHGIKAAVADLRYLDLRIAGNAPDATSLEAAEQALTVFGPLRLTRSDLVIPAALHTQLQGATLTISGWLPKDARIQHVTQLLNKLRPDLTIQTEEVKSHPRVFWPEGEKAPLTVESRLLAPLVGNLRVTPWLDLRRDAQGLHAAGVLPATGLRGQLMKLLEPLQAEQLLESTHTMPATFTQDQDVIPLLEAFFAEPGPRHIRFEEGDGPLLEGSATRQLEAQWLALLRPVTGGKRVRSHLTFYPSVFHLPGRKLISPLPAKVASELAETLQETPISFSTGSATLSATEQARLAALTPALLAAGPAVKLVIGGHLDPGSASARDQSLALARARQVLSFLVEQGLPTSDVLTVAFDSVPPGSPGALAAPHTVEILLR